MHSVKIINRQQSLIPTDVYIDGEKLGGVRNIKFFEAGVEKLPTFHFEVTGIPEEVEIQNADIKVFCTPETVQYSIKILRQQLLTDTELYQAFVSSIKSALNEMIPFGETDDNAKFILDRIIGREMQDGKLSEKSV